MIGSGNINSYGAHNHEHTVTKCLHTTHDTVVKSGGSMSGGLGAAATKAAEAKQESFSLTGLLSGGWESFVSKSFSLFGRIWRDGEAETERGTGQKGTVRPSAAETGRTVGIPAAAVESAAANMAAANVLATAAVRTQGEEKRSNTQTYRNVIKKVENKAGNMAEHKESTADGRLWKEQKEIRKFLQRFGKTAAKIRQPWRKREEEKKERDILSEENLKDDMIGDSSYLLDSYNRSGEYSTLAKDRSLEGRFRAMG